jgi:uncharacterized membrane protein
MTKGRLEAFSDGVIAIIITIMVLEFHAPHNDHSFHALIPLLPVFASYVMSFVYVGIYWNNHHHMFHAASHVTGLTLWANLHLLFWLSLTPFTTGWLGESHFAPVPTFTYGLCLFMCAVAWELLRRTLLANHPASTPLHRALRRSGKEYGSLLLYFLALPLAFVLPYASCAIYAATAALWFLPDRRIERELGHKP